MNRIRMLMLGVLCTHSAAASVAMADEVPGQARQATAVAQPTPPALSPTQQWLQLQRSGNSASAQAQPYSGEVMDKVHTRYLKSFEKPIPEFFEHEMRTAR